MHVENYSELSLESLNETQQEMGYKFAIKRGGIYAHVAFKTKRDLEIFLEERGLAKTNPLPDEEIYSHQMLEGSYRRILHSDTDEYKKARQRAFKVTGAWENGDCLECPLTRDDGVVTENIMNPNFDCKIFLKK